MCSPPPRGHGSALDAPSGVAIGRLTGDGSIDAARKPDTEAGRGPDRRFQWGSGDPEAGVGYRVGNIREFPRPYPATVLSSRSGAITGSTRIHRILEEVGSIAFPGVFDTLSAKLAHRPV